MVKERLLFVTRGGVDCDNGFNYILELAKTLNAGITLLMVYNKNIMQTYEDVMAAVAFAEAGDHHMVKDIMQEEGKRLEEETDKKINEIIEKCRENSVPFTYQIESEEVISAIKYFLKNNSGTEMVLLSPNLSESKKGIDLKKLIKHITKPVVTISRLVKAGA